MLHATVAVIIVCYTHNRIRPLFVNISYLLYACAAVIYYISFNILSRHASGSGFSFLGPVIKSSHEMGQNYSGTQYHALPASV